LEISHSVRTALSSPAALNTSILSLFTFLTMGNTDSLRLPTRLSQPDIEKLRSGRYKKLIESLEKSMPEKTPRFVRYNTNQTLQERRRARGIGPS